MRRKLAAAAILLAAGIDPITAASAATTLSGSLTSDNVFAIYLSTDDSVLGSLLTYGNNWPQAYSFSTGLAAGQNYFIHIIADNVSGPGNMSGGNPDSLAGVFTLSGTSFKFSNGTQRLVTDVADWHASPNPDGEQLPQDYTTTPAPHPGANLTWFKPTGLPVSFGLNGQPGLIWTTANGGPVSGIPNDADWIWSNPDQTGEAFFSASITAVPEPAEWALLMVGFGVLGFSLRARSRYQISAAA